MEAWYFEYFEVVGVWTVLGYSPRYFCCDQLFRPVDQVELVIILYAYDETIRLVLDSSRYIPICKVGFRQGHYQFESSLGTVMLELAKEHTVVAAEADLAFS